MKVQINSIAYDKRNHSELAIQCYKRILENKLHVLDFVIQKQKAIIESVS